MTPDELLRMWLKDHAENRFDQAIACEYSYRTGKFATVADRMAAVHRAAGDVYAAAVRALDADQPRSDRDRRFESRAGCSAGRDYDGGRWS
jgi:hypothetical protein